MIRDIEVVRMLEPSSEEEPGSIQYNYPYYYSSKSTARLNIVNAILEFYLIEELLLNFPSDFYLMERKKFSKLFINLILFRKDLSEKLARALFDYLCVSSFGEARHSINQSCGAHLVSSSLPEEFGDRYCIYNNAYEYSPAKFLPKLWQVFTYGDWKSGFGGIKWANITKAAMLYEKVHNQIFIDHVIDLAHNGGTAFDKDCVLTLSSSGFLMEILNSKFNSRGLQSAFSLHKFNSSIAISPQVKEIAIEIGARVFGNDFLHGLLRTSSKELEFPVPVQWESGDIEIFIDKSHLKEYKKKKKNYDDDDSETDFTFNSFYKKMINNFLNIQSYTEKLVKIHDKKFCKDAEEAVIAYKLYKKEERRLKKENKVMEKKFESKCTKEELIILHPVDSMSQPDLTIEKYIPKNPYIGESENNARLP